jgi:hypothetical protein
MEKVLSILLHGTQRGFQVRKHGDAGYHVLRWSRRLVATSTATEEASAPMINEPDIMAGTVHQENFASSKSIWRAL